MILAVGTASLFNSIFYCSTLSGRVYPYRVGMANERLSLAKVTYEVSIHDCLGFEQRQIDEMEIQGLYRCRYYSWLRNITRVLEKQIATCEGRRYHLEFCFYRTQ